MQVFKNCIVVRKYFTKHYNSETFFWGGLVIRMDYVPKLAKNSLYVAIKVNCRVKVAHLLVQCVLVLSISQLINDM